MKWILVLLSLCFVVPVSAQSDDCFNGIPCGPVPPHSSLPALVSPSPYPTIFIEATPTPTLAPEVTAEPGEPTFTPTPTIAPTNEIPIDGIFDGLSTLAPLFEMTEEVIIIDDTIISRETNIEDLTDQGAVFISYAVGLFKIDIGVFQPLWVLFWLIFFGVFFTIITTSIIPVLGVLWGWIRSVVQIVLDFIPG